VLTAIDHVIIASPDPDADAVAVEEVLGLRAGGGGKHDAHGTFNRLFWMGDSYVELMGVFDSALAAESWWGRHVAALLAGRSAAFAGMALTTGDLAADVSRLRAQGSPISDPVQGQRTRPDGREVRWRIGRLAAVDPELGLAFLIEHDSAAAEWTAAERATRGDEIHPVGTPARLLRVELSVAQVARTTQRLHRDLGLAFRPSLAGGGARDTSVGSQVLRLVPRQSAATIAIRAGHERRELDLLGCHWVVEPAISG
jgi:hypothetical protein